MGSTISSLLIQASRVESSNETIVAILLAIPILMAHFPKTLHAFVRHSAIAEPRRLSIGSERQQQQEESRGIGDIDSNNVSYDSSVEISTFEFGLPTILEEDEEQFEDEEDLGESLMIQALTSEDTEDDDSDEELSLTREPTFDQCRKGEVDGDYGNKEEDEDEEEVEESTKRKESSRPKKRRPATRIPAPKVRIKRETMKPRAQKQMRLEEQSAVVEEEEQEEHQREEEGLQEQEQQQQQVELPEYEVADDEDYEHDILTHLDLPLLDEETIQTRNSEFTTSGRSGGGAQGRFGGGLQESALSDRVSSSIPSVSELTFEDSPVSQAGKPMRSLKELMKQQQTKEVKLAPGSHYLDNQRSRAERLADDLIKAVANPQKGDFTAILEQLYDTPGGVSSSSDSFYGSYYAKKPKNRKSRKTRMGESACVLDSSISDSTETTTTSLSELSHLSVPTSVFLDSVSQSLSHQVLRADHDEKISIGDSLYQLGEILCQETKYKQAKAIFRRCEQVRRTVVTETLSTVASAMLKQGKHFQLTGQEDVSKLYLKVAEDLKLHPTPANLNKAFALHREYDVGVKGNRDAMRQAEKVSRRLQRASAEALPLSEALMMVARCKEYIRKCP